MRARDFNWCRCGRREQDHPRDGCEGFLDRDSVEARTERLAREKLTAHGLWAKGWRFQWNTTSKRHAGWSKPRTRRIEVAEWVLELDWPWEEVRDVVLHEVAHAIVWRDGGLASSHGPEWKRVAERIGADPTRCYDGSLPTVERLWREYCPECGWERRLHRLGRGGSCPDCGDGSFNPDLLVHIEATDGRPVTAKGIRETYTRYDALDRLPPGTEGT